MLRGLYYYKSICAAAIGIAFCCQPREVRSDTVSVVAGYDLFETMGGSSFPIRTRTFGQSRPSSKPVPGAVPMRLQTEHPRVARADYVAHGRADRARQQPNGRASSLIVVSTGEPSSPRG